MAGSILLQAEARACQVPVFRYALERWEADRYKCVVLHRGPAEGELAQTITYLRDNVSGVNMTLETHDLDTLSEDALWQLTDVPEEGALPLVQFFYPPVDGEERLCWQGPPSVDDVRRFLASPLREEILRHLAEGQSAVWVLVESGDKEADERCWNTLTAALKNLESDMEIPEGVISVEQAGQAAHPDGDPLEMDDVLRSSIPLTIAFASLRVSREAAEESGLLAQIEGRFPERWSGGETLVFPVFGRGRILDVLPGAAVSGDTIGAMARYLCGACSCQVKSENPGFDLLIKASWDSFLSGNLVVVERAPPPLTGVGDLVAPAAEAVQGAESRVSGPSPSWFRGIYRSLAIAVGITLLLLAMGTLFFKSKRP